MSERDKERSDNIRMRLRRMLFSGCVHCGIPQSQREIADRLEISYKTMNKFMNEHIDLSGKTLNQIELWLYRVEK